MYHANPLTFRHAVLCVALAGLLLNCGGAQQAQPEAEGGSGAAAGDQGGGASGGSPGSHSTGSYQAGAAGLGCVARDVLGTQASYDREAAQRATPNDFGFFAFPWPELSRSPIELANLPNPASATDCRPLISDPLMAQLITNIDPVTYRDYAARLASQHLTEGPNQVQIVMQFDGPLDEARLPDPVESLDAATSPILLVDLERSAPRGRLVPTLTRVLNGSRYTAPNTLSILPYPGFPLSPNHRYAAVVRRSLGDAEGAALGSPAAFEAKKLWSGCSPDPEYLAAFEMLEEELSIERDEIAMMSVFRAGSPTAKLESRLRDISVLEAPATLANVTITTTTLDAATGHFLIAGAFENLIVQQGTPPYLPDISVGLLGTTIDLDPDSTDGRLLTQALPTRRGGTDTGKPRTETNSFKLVVPSSVLGLSASPASLPVVIYGPGTGGTIDSCMNSGVASELADQGIATFCTTPVLHQERAHAENLDPTVLSTLALLGYDDDLITLVESGSLFFNPLNLQAAKGNSQQAALDYAWLGRILGDLTLNVTLDGTTVALRFSPAALSYFGHSQGAATGPLFASSPQIRAEVLSAPAGHLTTNLLGKTMPADSLSIATLLDYLVCDAPDAPLDVHHPFLNLLLYWFEEVDAANFAPLLTMEATGAPKHVFVLGGIDDHYVAPESHNATVAAARLNQLAPKLADVKAQTLLATLSPTGGYDTLHATLSGNLAAPSHNVTGAFRQYHDATCDDDHFVATCTSEAVRDWSRFLTTLASGVPTVP